MSSSNKRRYRPVNKKGRNKFGSPFVKLDAYVLRSDAYLSLKALPRAVYTELRRRFNGRNNGQISCSVRELERELHCSKDSASRALKELAAKGFIKCSQGGSFNYKIRHASSWILTEEEHAGLPPTKDFMRWVPPQKKVGPKSRTACPEIRTDETRTDAE